MLATWVKGLRRWLCDRMAAEEEGEPRMQNALTIRQTDNVVHTLKILDWQGTNPNEPWQAFLDWYLEGHTLAHLILVSSGSVLVNRHKISSITVIVREMT